MTKRIILLQALASTPNDINRLVRSRDKTSAGWRPLPGDWSCRDVVNHLRYIEPLYLARLQRVIAEDEPAVPTIHPDTVPDDPELTISDLAGRFRAAREATLTFLQELSPGGWQRVAHHERNGRMTFRYLVQDLVSHDIEHTNQLVEIQSRYRAALKQQAVVVRGRDGQ